MAGYEQRARFRQGRPTGVALASVTCGAWPQASIDEAYQLAIIPVQFHITSLFHAR